MCIRDRYIDTIHRQFGTMRMNSFPNLWLSSWMKWMLAGIKQYRPLWYVDYVKSDAMSFLKRKFGWQWYDLHHAENVFAAFNFYYWLPQKFGIDLRFLELGAFVRSGQMSREDALRELEAPVPYNAEWVEEVKKRLSFTNEEFQKILSQPNKTYRDYKTYRKTFRRLRPIFWLMYKANRAPKSFYIKYAK